MMILISSKVEIMNELSLNLGWFYTPLMRELRVVSSEYVDIREWKS